MLGLISRIMTGSPEREYESELQTSAFSSDEEKLENHGVPKINLDDSSTAIETGNNDCSFEQVIKSLQIAKHNLAKYENDCDSRSSSTCESTDSSSPRELRKKQCKLPSRDVQHRVAELVEYYLSDENLANDMFLLKHVTKHKEGYVSLKLLANYKKLKRVKMEWTVLVVALEYSEKLEINSDGTKVRRRKKIPCELEEDTRLFRSVLGYEIPAEFASMDKLAEIFSKSGEIDSIQLHKPDGRSFPEVHLAEKEYPGLASSFCCLIVYDKVHCARLALKHLTNSAECPLKVMAVPRGKPSKDDRRLHVAPTREYESAYFSASDLEDPGSPFLFRSRNLQQIVPLRSTNSNNWRSRCFSTDSSISSPRSPRSTQRGTSSICSSNDDRCLSNLSMQSNTHIRMKYHVTPNSTPLSRRLIPPRTLATPPDSPSPLRRLPLRLPATSAPNSPWGRRKMPSQVYNNDKSSGGNGFSHSRPALLPDNVIRMPKGPDDSKGFTTARLGISIA